MKTTVKKSAFGKNAAFGKIAALGLTGFLVFTLPAADAEAARLKSDVIVSGSQITLGDIFDEAGAASDVVIAESPVPGLTDTLSVSRISAMARRNGLDWRNRDGLTHIAVKRTGLPVGTEEVRDVLAEVAPDRAADLAEAVTAPIDTSDRFEKLINVKDRGQIFRVEVDTIEHIEAAGDYMIISTGDNSLVLRETMKDLERRLDPRKFQRVHRSTIVNLDLVRQVRPHTNGECFLVLESGAEVKVSRSYRDVVARFVH